MWVRGFDAVYLFKDISQVDSEAEQLFAVRCCWCTGIGSGMLNCSERDVLINIDKVGNQT